MSISAVFPKEAQWIGLPEPAPQNQPECGNPALFLRREFELTEKAPARISYAGLGLSVVMINGRRVGDAVLETGFTDYRKSVIAASEDVGELLQVGKNVIEVMLGDGWYNQTAKDEWGFYQAPWRGARKLILSLTVGERVVLVSDTNWLASTEGFLRASAIRLGEVHDYRCRIDWTCAAHAILHEPPAGRLKYCEMPLIRECESLDFVSCTEYEGGWLLDFGKNIAGYARLYTILPAGGTVKLRHGDRLENGRIDNTSNAQYIGNAHFEYQTDTYISDGKQRSYHPHFAYHGFQYVEVEGLDHKPVKGEIQGISVHSDFCRIGHFRCSDERLNKLYEMSIASAEANFHAMPTDCPHREKNGWTGDAQLSIEQYLLNYECVQNFDKWLEDIAEAQREDGAIPCIVPTGGWGFRWGNGPAWDFALFAIPEAMERYRGYQNSVLPTAVKYFDYLEGKSEENLVRLGLGDWNYPKNVPVEVAPLELIASCYYLQMSRLLARWTGEARYTKRAEAIRTAIDEKYADAPGMCAIAAMTYFDVRDRFEELLCELKKCDYHYRAGILGVQYVNRVLAERGRTDLILRLLRQKDYPSFLYWSELGGTALWEDFEGKNSRCHHMYSDIAAVLMRAVGGIRVLSPTEVCICPDHVDLDWFEVSTELPAGRVSVTYRDGSYTVELPDGVKQVENR